MLVSLLMTLSFCAVRKKNIIDELNSGKYLFELQRYSYSVDSSGNRGAKISELSGNGIRNLGYYHLNTDRYYTIEENKLFACVDNKVKIIFYGNKDSVGISAINFLFDPQVILGIAQRNGVKKQIGNDSHQLESTFDNSYPIKFIKYKYWMKRDSADILLITVRYQQQYKILEDQLLYKFRKSNIDDGIKTPSLKSIITNSSGNYQISEQYKDFSFMNLLNQ